MHLQLIIPQNARNKVFRDKEIKSKLPLIFLDVNMLKERNDRHF